MKTMTRRILPLGLLLVFAVYGYSQTNTTNASPKDTKTTKTTSCCDKSTQAAKSDCAGHEKGKCAVEGKSGCKESGTTCCRGKSEGSNCKTKATGTQATTTDKTTTPKK